MMYVDKIDFMSKTNNVINSAIKNTSCSRGWLRLTVQSIFCSVIVASFCIIVFLSYQRSPLHIVEDRGLLRCSIFNCRVVCVQAPSLGDYEDHIVLTVMEATKECDSVYLTLNRPKFRNSSLPVHWLANLRGRVVEFGIVGGNLRHIPPDAFMSTFFHDVETLVFEELTISTWHSEMLSGLFRLKAINIRDCKIEQIQKNALREVDSTLRRLVIRSSGYFNPENFTGSSHLVKLKDVNFSTNDFNGVLNRNSFRELSECRVLSLASSRITNIQENTFDYLRNIQMIYLNNNRLTTVPSGTFDRILVWGRNRRLTIDLQDNMWKCDCQIERLREMHYEGIVITDPVCLSPIELNGTPFSRIETFCNESTEDAVKNYETYDQRHGDRLRETVSIYMTKDCFVNATAEYNYTASYNCSYGRMKYHDSYSLQFITQNAKKFTTELQPIYYVEDANFSLVEISLKSTINYGLFWYQSSCPNEIYCIERLPSNMRLFNVGINEWYTICPIHHSGFIKIDSCIAFNPSSDLGGPADISRLRMNFFLLAIIGAGLLGALLVYALIRKNPALLKGSKRIVFVKHEFADALVLPPKIPPRFDTIKERRPMNKNVLVVPRTLDGFTMPIFSRTSSIKSSKSSSPSYVSAIQPTDSQLTEWRLRQHFRESSTPSLPPKVTLPDQISWIYDQDPLYFSISSNTENIYENK